MVRLGLVGLPNAGKSTVFNALTGMGVPVAAHPFSTVETVVGVAPVPDDRVEQLGVMSASRRVVHATVEVTDIAALVRGSSTGEGLGNRFLGNLREVDALLFVVRSFDAPGVPGAPDPSGDLETLELELVMADLASVEARLERQRKAAKADPALGPEVDALEQAAGFLADGVPLYRAEIPEDRRRHLVPAFLLTDKPAIVVVNIGEGDIERADEIASAVGASRDDGRPLPTIAVCAQLEMEAALLDADTRSEMVEGLGLGAGAISRVAAVAYHALGRRTFFTTGDKESRAWTFRAGAKAPECAGVIHSDLERGFIRAEVIEWTELLEIGSWAKAKELGRLRIEGKDYEVEDGDVLEIRFNV